MSKESEAEPLDLLSNLYAEVVRDRDLLESKVTLFSDFVSNAPAVLWTANKEGKFTFAKQEMARVDRLHPRRI